MNLIAKVNVDDTLSVVDVDVYVVYFVKVDVVVEVFVVVVSVVIVVVVPMLVVAASAAAASWAPATVAAVSASAAATADAKVAVVVDAEKVVVAAEDVDVSDEDVDVDCKVHVDQDGRCKVQVVDHSVDVDALSDDDVEHVVDAILCCFLLSLVDVVVEVVVVDDLSLDALDEDVLCKVLIEDASCTMFEVDL